MVLAGGVDRRELSLPLFVRHTLQRRGVQLVKVRIRPWLLDDTAVRQLEPSRAADRSQRTLCRSAVWTPTALSWRTAAFRSPIRRQSVVHSCTRRSCKRDRSTPRCQLIGANAHWSRPAARAHRLEALPLKQRLAVAAQEVHALRLLLVILQPLHPDR